MKTRQGADARPDFPQNNPASCLPLQTSFQNTPKLFSHLYLIFSDIYCTMLLKQSQTVIICINYS